MTTEKELYRLSREQFKEAFKYYYEAGKSEFIKEIDNWLKDRTFIHSDKEGTNCSIIRFLPFEWEDFKGELTK